MLNDRLTDVRKNACESRGTTGRCAERPASRRPIAVLAVALVASLLSMGGCNIVAPAAYIVEGPPSVNAQYKLPERKIVVFVDDRDSVIPRTRLRRILADRATDELLVKKREVPAAVAPDAAARLAQNEDADNLLSIDEIGRRVGAEVVIYVRPIQFSVASAGMPQPMAMMGVKVIDCTTGRRLFPENDDQGPQFILTATMAMKPGSQFETADAIQNLEESLAEFAGLRVAQIFYKHETNPLDGEVSQ